MRTVGLALAAAALIGLFACGGCARILVVLPFPARSHHMFATAIMGALAERGHSIVEYSPFPPKATIPNHTHHRISSSLERGADEWTFEIYKEHAKKFDSCIFGARIQVVWEMTDKLCEETFQEESIKALLKSKEEFDLVLAYTTLGQESLLVFGHRFSVPTIVMDTHFPHSLLNWGAGNSLSVASIPDLHAATMGGSAMTFLERALNFISTLRTLYFYHNVHLPKQEAIMRSATVAAGLGEVPPLEELVANVSLYLTNSHPSAVHYPQPYTPNVVPVAGVTIDPDKQQLTPELESFMSSASDGVIYLSFGSNIPAHTMPKKTFQIFINVIKLLPQKVLWKIDMTKVEFYIELPSNLKTIKWAPQLAVLGHRSCRLFVTHGGLFSHQEALRSAVPTVYVPFFADQPYNARVAETRATGRTVTLEQLTERTLLEAVTAVLTDPRYKENAKKMSLIFRDLPVAPKDLVVYWVEYVMRHLGAPHLRPASVTMAWYKLLQLDIIILTTTLFVIVALTLYKITYFVRKLLFRRGRNFVKNKKDD